MTDRSILLICGSVRTASTNRATLDTAAHLAPPDVRTRFAQLGELPHFNPDLDAEPLPDSVADLRHAIAEAHALLFCTPEYAGYLPGSLKNLLDWTVGGMEISDKPSGWINISTAAAGAAGAHAELRTVLRYTDARVVDEACVHLPVSRSDVGADGLIDDPALRAAISAVISTLVSAPKAES